MVQRAPYLLVYKVTQCRHLAHKGDPRCVLLGVSIRLDPQAVAHHGDGALEQLVPPDLGLKEGLKRGGSCLGLALLLLQL
jgi:hypothetical protein